MRNYFTHAQIQSHPATFAFKNNGVEANAWSDFKAYENECFVFTLGLSKHHHFTSEVIGDTVITAYKILSKKFFYFESHGELLKRLLSIAQQKSQKLVVTHGDVKVVLGIVCVSSRNWWMGISDEQLRPAVIKKSGRIEEMSSSKNTLRVISGLKSDTKGLLLGTGAITYQTINKLTHQLDEVSADTIAEILLAQLPKSRHQGLLWVQL